MSVVPNAVSVKNDILQKLNQCDDRDEFIGIMTNLLGLLEYGKGFWAELGYCYKAVEIIDRALVTLQDFSNGLENMQPMRPMRRAFAVIFEKQMDRLISLKSEYQELHRMGKSES